MVKEKEIKRLCPSSSWHSSRNEEDKEVETKERRAVLSAWRVRRERERAMKRLRGEEETGEKMKEELQKRIRRD